MLRGAWKNNMNNTLEYKGYLGKFAYDQGDDAFHGTVLNLRDVIHFTGRSIDELRQSLQDSVEDYPAWCAQEGKTPEKPCTGKSARERKRKVSA